MVGKLGSLKDTRDMDTEKIFYQLERAVFSKIFA